jgi:hypothetical protein
VQSLQPNIDKKYVCTALSLPKLDILASIVKYIPTTPLIGNPVITIEQTKNYHVPRKSPKKLAIETFQTSKGKNMSK